VENNFEILRSIERTVKNDAGRPIASLQEKIMELRRQVDQLDRRLRDRSNIVDVRMVELELLTSNIANAFVYIEIRP
jgi:predicted glycoside hydrolase/deacetylase ChbG (UPF0249 family)